MSNQPQQTIDAVHLKTVRLVSHQAEMLFNKDEQIAQLVGENQALRKAHHEVSQELAALKGIDKDAKVPKSPEPQAVLASPPSPSTAPNAVPSSASSSAAPADSEGGEPA